MEYKMIMVQKLEATEEELNDLGGKGYRIASGPVIVIGGKTFLVMERPISSFSRPESKPEKAPPKPKLAKKDPPIKKTSEDSAEVK